MEFFHDTVPERLELRDKTISARIPADVCEKAREVAKRERRPLSAVFAIAKGRIDDESEAFELAQSFSENLTRLRQILQMDLPVQVVPPRATIDDAIDIFDCVNSQGTKLTDADVGHSYYSPALPPS